MKRARRPRIAPGAAPAFPDLRSATDRRVLDLFQSRALERTLREQGKTNLESVWQQASKELKAPGGGSRRQSAGALDVHRRIVAGLPGIALVIASAMAYDSMQEALPLFDLSPKTAKLRLWQTLAPNEGEIALRIGRVLTMAGDALGSLDAARQYLRTPNFALGGAAPRELLRTAEGEQIVLAEIQAQAQGGPV
jgi:putative toxin-antitoxin system antitoxin component (TIGR02293 family)